MLRERLRQRRKNQKHGRPFSFLVLNSGKGIVWRGDEGVSQISGELDDTGLHTLMDSLKSGVTEEESKETDIIELEDIRKLGVATLGSLKQHPRISAFRKFIEGWYLSYFTPDAARSLPGKPSDDPGQNPQNVV